MKRIFRLLIVVVLSQSLVSCTAIVGAGIKHAMVTPPSKGSYVVAAENASVLSQAKELLLSIGAVENASESMLVGTDKDKTYRYTITFAQGTSSSETRLTIEIVLIGNYQQARGLTTTKEKSLEFTKSLGTRLRTPVVPVK